MSRAVTRKRGLDAGGHYALPGSRGLRSARHPLTRIFCGLLALWIGVAIADPPHLHVCPMHDSPLSLMQMHHGGGSHTGSQDAHQHNCTCLGACAAAALASQAGPRGELRASIVAAADYATSYTLHLPITADHVLPFSNAPPFIA